MTTVLLKCQEIKLKCQEIKMSSKTTKRGSAILILIEIVKLLNLNSKTELLGYT